ncbi:hypothetical protein CO157_02155 [Candidatus Peregrinibacteria bacterium CG_4_9_14_3_um_filter_49_12]|nr:MAG: hypothetical protein COV83_04690 [Candidatus Peregrinibacteria bacterium CG11_big_fil_rev_8_21_14_0_20_49_14]PJA67939.1 MAG: hypothetical protein CO157_02155 [Candidatus Peregrinibacteria bacterium CG_4_9_14_3_um_filter_49_12]
MPFLPFGSDRASTGSTLHHAKKWVLVLSLSVFLAAFHEHPLHFVEQFFGNDRFVYTFVEFALEQHQPAVDGTLEKFFDAGKIKRVAVAVPQAFLLQHVSDLFQCVLARRVCFKGFADEWRHLWVGIYASGLAVVDVPEWRHGRPESATQFLPVSALHVLA